MTWQAIAGLDLTTYRADGTLRNFGAFFVLAGAATGALAPAGSVPTLLGGFALFGAPLTAVTLAHEPLPSRVASGRTRLTLSLPHSRSEYVVGVGAVAFAVAAAAGVLAVLVGLVTAVAAGTPVDVGSLVTVLAGAVALTAASVGATLAVTAGVRSTTLAATLAYGGVLLAFVWPMVVAGFAVVLDATVGASVPQAVFDYAIPATPLYGALYALGFGGFSAGLAWPEAARVAGVLSLAAWSAGGTAFAVRRFDSLEL